MVALKESVGAALKVVCLADMMVFSVVAVWVALMAERSVCWTELEAAAY